MRIMYELCNRIAAFRNNLGITQAELAKKLNISRSAVNSWEMGTSTPQLKHVIEMAEIFHITLDGMVTSSERVTVDITDLDPKEQQVILVRLETVIRFELRKIQKPHFLRVVFGNKLIVHFDYLYSAYAEPFLQISPVNQERVLEQVYGYNNLMRLLWVTVKTKNGAVRSPTDCTAFL